jgi:catechol 2,3-dioxygenase-like lactoylglutathione lyase family enzyme
VRNGESWVRIPFGPNLIRLEAAELRELRPDSGDWLTVCVGATRKQGVAMQLEGAMLFVKELDRMTAFYRNILQLQPVEDTRLDNWVEFKGDGARFSLHDQSASNRSEHPHRLAAAAARARGIKLTFIVRDLHSTLERITAIALPLLKRPWGGTDAVDPEGNVFALSAPR